MITGVVNQDLEAEVRLTVRGPTGRTRRIRAVIDTGYDGHLLLPRAIIAKLGLPWKRKDSAILANGEVASFDVFDGAVGWDGRRRAVYIDEADTEPLLGTAMLEGYRLNADFCPGGRVAIRALRRPAS